MTETRERLELVCKENLDKYLSDLVGLKEKEKHVLHVAQDIFLMFDEKTQAAFKSWLKWYFFND